MILLPIRLKQISREMKNVQLALLAIMFIVALTVTISFSMHQEMELSAYQFIILLALCLGIQLYRNDKHFVYRHIRKPHLEIYIEYFALTFLFSVGVLFHGHWYFFFLFQCLLALVPLIRLNISAQNFYFNPILKWIDPSAFELLSGMRKALLYLVPLYLLSVALLWVKILPLVLLWLITTTIASFFVECEPIKILQSSNRSPMKFLKFKIWLYSKFLLLICLPVLIVSTAFHPEHWIVNLLFLLVQMALLVLAIINKYRCYTPNKNLDSNNLVVSMASLGPIVPFFLPVPFIMAIVYFPKALKNLTHYL